MKVKNERIFVQLSVECCEPTRKGREQFFRMQSFGEEPETPDNYYLHLMGGKGKFDFLTKEYLNNYRSGEWWGFLQLWRDWKGNRFILPKLCSWYKGETGRELPSWLSSENVTEEQIFSQ